MLDPLQGPEMRLSGVLASWALPTALDCHAFSVMLGSQMKNSALEYWPLRPAAIAAVAALLLVFALTGFAQSGRRARKAEPLPPVPTPEASPTPTPKKSPERPATPVFIGVNAYDSTVNIPLYFSDSVGKSCAERLSQRSSVNVELSSRDVTRAEAIRKAKDAKVGFVVLLELRSDRMNREGRDAELSRLYLEYAVFSAGAGKQLSSGNVYQQSGGIRDIMVGRDSTSAAENRLKQAARIAAERILAVIIEHEP